MTDRASDRQAISTVLPEHVEAVNSTDVELLPGGFTDDLVSIAPGMAPVLGKLAMGEYITPIHDRASISIVIEPEALELRGDRAVEWGTCHGEMCPGCGPEAVTPLTKNAPAAPATGANDASGSSVVAAGLEPATSTM